MKTLSILLSFLFLILTPVVRSQEECDESSREMREEQINILAFAPVLGVDIPESCGDFQPTQLLDCAPEVNVLEGCCVDSCRDLLAQYDSTCLQEIAANICQTNSASAVELLNSIAARCDDDYQLLSCIGAEATAPSSEISPVDEMESATASESAVLIELDEELEEPETSLEDTEDELSEPEMELAERNLLSMDPISGDSDACLASRETDPAVDAAEFLPLLTRLDLPQSCGNFTVRSLLRCREELEIASGCCNERCRNTFEEIPQTCLRDLSNAMCINYTELLFPLARVSVRCKANYEVQPCSALNLQVVTDQNGYQTVVADLENTEDTDGAIIAHNSPFLLFTFLAGLVLLGAGF